MDIHLFVGNNMSSDLMLIGTKIRQERKAQSMTQTELANLSGVSLNFLSQLEQGKPSVQMDKVLMVLDTLGLRIELAYSK
jgi:y4mF family transcriptional regulator